MGFIDEFAKAAFRFVGGNLLIERVTRPFEEGVTFETFYDEFYGNMHSHQQIAITIAMVNLDWLGRHGKCKSGGHGGIKIDNPHTRMKKHARHLQTFNK